MQIPRQFLKTPRLSNNMERTFYADEFLNKNKEYYVEVPVNAIVAFANVALIAGILIYSFGVAKGRKLAA